MKNGVKMDVLQPPFRLLEVKLVLLVVSTSLDCRHTKIPTCEIFSRTFFDRRVLIFREALSGGQDIQCSLSLQLESEEMVTGTNIANSTASILHGKFHPEHYNIA